MESFYVLWKVTGDEVWRERVWAVFEAIEKHAKTKNCSVIRTYVGHGINTAFHPPPSIPHYAKNKAVGECKPGMTFTIEPMVALGKYKDVTWPDNWTSTTIDGKRTAQFGESFPEQAQCCRRSGLKANEHVQSTPFSSPRQVARS